MKLYSAIILIVCGVLTPYGPAHGQQNPTSDAKSALPADWERGEQQEYFRLLYGTLFRQFPTDVKLTYREASGPKTLWRHEIAAGRYGTWDSNTGKRVRADGIFGCLLSRYMAERLKMTPPHTSATFAGAAATCMKGKNLRYGDGTPWPEAQALYTRNIQAVLQDFIELSAQNEFEQLEQCFAYAGPRNLAEINHKKFDLPKHIDNTLYHYWRKAAALTQCGIKASTTNEWVEDFTGSTKLAANYKKVRRVLVTKAVSNVMQTYDMAKQAASTCDTAAQLPVCDDWADTQAPGHTTPTQTTSCVGENSYEACTTTVQYAAKSSLAEFQALGEQNLNALVTGCKNDLANEADVCSATAESDASDCVSVPYLSRCVAAFTNVITANQSKWWNYQLPSNDLAEISQKTNEAVNEAIAIVQRQFKRNADKIEPLTNSYEEDIFRIRRATSTLQQCSATQEEWKALNTGLRETTARMAATVLELSPLIAERNNISRNSSYLMRAAKQGEAYIQADKDAVQWLQEQGERATEGAPSPKQHIEELKQLAEYANLFTPERCAQIEREKAAAAAQAEMNKLATDRKRRTIGRAVPGKYRCKSVWGRRPATYRTLDRDGTWQMEQHYPRHVWVGGKWEVTGGGEISFTWEQGSREYSSDIQRGTTRVWEYTESLLTVGRDTPVWTRCRKF